MMTSGKFVRAVVACLLLGLVAISSCAEDDDDDDSVEITALAPGVGWFWQLSSSLQTGFEVAVYDIDLFDYSASQITALKESGKVVICYFSAGSYEDWRDDVTDVSESVLGNELDGWEGEKWWDIRTDEVQNLLWARLDLAVAKGCNGVEPDNVDGYRNDNGLGLTEAEQVDFNTYLAQQAHSRGLSVGLKNAPDLITQLIAYFDWSLVEECGEYNECEPYEAFIGAGKAVLQAEYIDLTESLCADASDRQFSIASFALELDGTMNLCSD